MYVKGSEITDDDIIPSSSVATYTSNSSKFIIKGSTEPNATVVGYHGGKPVKINMDKKTGNFTIEVKPSSSSNSIQIQSTVKGKLESFLVINFEFPNVKSTSEDTDLISSTSSETQPSMELDAYDKGYEHGYLDGWYGDYYNSFSGEFGVGYQKGYEYGSSDNSQGLTPEFEIYGAYTRWEP